MKKWIKILLVTLGIIAVLVVTTILLVASHREKLP